MGNVLGGDFLLSGLLDVIGKKVFVVINLVINYMELGLVLVVVGLLLMMIGKFFMKV